MLFVSIKKWHNDNLTQDIRQNEKINATKIWMEIYIEWEVDAVLKLRCSR